MASGLIGGAGRGLLAALALAGGIGAWAPEPLAQGVDILRSTGRAAERAIRSQIGRALRPSLEVRNAYDDPPVAVSASADGTHLAVVTPDGGLRVFDLVDGRQVLDRPAAGDRLSGIALGSAGRPVLARTTRGAVLLAPSWQEAPGRLMRLASRAEATALALGGALGAVGHADGAVSLLDARSGREIAALPPTGEAITAIAVAPSGRFALAGDEDGGLRAIDERGRAIPVSGGPEDEITAIAHLVGPLFAAGDEDGRLALVDASTGQTLKAWDAHSDEIAGIAGLGERFATADEDGTVKIWDGTGRETARPDPGWDGEVTALAAAGGRLLVTGPDEAIHLLDPARGARLATLFVTRVGWGAVGAAGRFDGDVAAFQDVAWRAGELRLPVENLSARYFEPGLLATHIRGGRFLTSPRERIAERLYPPPYTTLEVLAEPSAPGQPIRLEITAEAGSASEIGEIRLFHNGKRVPPSALGAPRSSGEEVRITAEVPAVPGENRLTAVAQGWAEIDGLPAEAVVSVGGGQAARLRVTAVGIDRYAGRDLRLNYAVADAQAVADQLARRARGAFAGVETELLLDRAASREGIRTALASLAAAEASDVAVLFLAGHARSVGDAWYFLPRELDDLRDDRQVARLGLSGADLAAALTAAAAQNILLVIDACQSGAILGSFESFAQRRALQELKRETGVAVIAATRADQLAPEYSKLGHGLLTYTLLEGLGARGGQGADRAPRDGRVTAGELKSYVEERAPRLAAELDATLPGGTAPRGDFSQRVPVTPVGLVIGADFPLAR